MAFLNKMMSVRMILRQVLYVCYRVPASLIRPYVPNKLHLAIVGEDEVFVSIVSMTCERVRLASLPWPTFNYNQLNVRTYVNDPQTGNHAVYFFHSGVTSSLISILTGFFGIPWQNIELYTNHSYNDNLHLSHYSIFAEWEGKISIKSDDFREELDEIAPFGSPEQAIDYLIGPLIGFIGPTEGTSRFEIRHKPLQHLIGRVTEIYFPLIIDSGLLEQEKLARPSSVLLVPEAHFTVILPPRHI
jgi:hypothetical protein